jgi:ERCC4-type nuclease
MTIQIDSREKTTAILHIINHFDTNNITWFRSKLPVGDYMSLDNARLVIDRKQNLQELCGNVTQDHWRFVAELDRAVQYGIKLIVLCEHSPTIKTLNDVKTWYNPRLKTSPQATTG